MVDKIEKVEKWNENGKREEGKKEIKALEQIKNKDEVIDRFKLLESRLERIVIDNCSQNKDFQT